MVGQKCATNRIDKVPANGVKIKYKQLKLLWIAILHLPKGPTLRRKQANTVDTEYKKKQFLSFQLVDHCVKMLNVYNCI